MKKSFLLLCTLLLVLGCALPLAAYHLTRAVLGPAILTAFLKLSPADQDAILRYVDGVVSELNAQPAAPDLDVDAEVEAYRQELLAQKKAEAAASATAGSAAG